MAFADDLKSGIERAIRIVQLDRAAITQVAMDPNALVVGVVIVAIAGLAGGIGSIRQSVAAVFFAPPVMVVASFIAVGIYYLVGLLFKPPTWDYQQLYRSLSHGWILQWLGVATIVPILGQLVGLAIGIWMLVVAVVVVETVGKVDRMKAILIVLIPSLVCCAIVVAIIAMVGVAALGLGAAMAR